MRFTLSKLLLSVAFAALACGGLVEPTHWFLRLIVTVTIALYSVTAVRIIALKGRERVFFIAFCLFGVGYMLLVMTSVGRFLITNYPLAHIAIAKEMTFPNGPVSYSPPLTVGNWVDEVTANTMRVPSDEMPAARLFLIGHCAWSWLFALLGGWFAAYAYCRREESQRAYPKNTQ